MSENLIFVEHCRVLDALLFMQEIEGAVLFF
jgi:hypothetical protein